MLADIMDPDRLNRAILHLNMGSKEESGFDKLAELIKGESDDIREHIDALGNRVDLLEHKMDSGFAAP